MFKKILFTFFIILIILILSGMRLKIHTLYQNMRKNQNRPE